MPFGRLYFSNFHTTKKEKHFCSSMEAPILDIYSNPHRIPIMDYKKEWEQEFLNSRERDEPAMRARWEKEMVGDALVSFREELKLKETLVFDYESYPFDMAALFLRENIKMLQKRYPRDLVEFFFGDWDRYNDLTEELMVVDENIKGLHSQKHLEEWLQIKEELEKEQFFLGILIHALEVPRIDLKPEHLPFDFEENFLEYQRPKEKKRPSAKRNLFCLEKKISPELDRMKNWELPLRVDDPHQLFFEIAYKDISEDFLPGIEEKENSSPQKKIKREN